MRAEQCRGRLKLGGFEMDQKQQHRKTIDIANNNNLNMNTLITSHFFKKVLNPMQSGACLSAWFSKGLSMHNSLGL